MVPFEGIRTVKPEKWFVLKQDMFLFRSASASVCMQMDCPKSPLAVILSIVGGEMSDSDKCRIFIKQLVQSETLAKLGILVAFTYPLESNIMYV
jgi:hypothetical protein